MNLQTLIPIVMKASVFLSVFAIGLAASVRDAGYLFRRPRELFCALLAMNVLMPAFAAALVLFCNLSPPVNIALIALSISPIPPLLPKKLVKSGGTGSYAIGLLIAAALLSILFVPLTMEIIERVLGVPVQMTAVSVATLIITTVLLPIGLGVATRTFAPAVAGRLGKPIALISGIALLACVVVLVIAAAPALRTLMGNGTAIAFAAFVVVGLAVGHILGGPERDNRTALAISSASRHPGIAVAIAQANFPEQKLAMVAVLFYLLVNAVVSIPYVSWSKRRTSA